MKRKSIANGLLQLSLSAVLLLIPLKTALAEDGADRLSDKKPEKTETPDGKTSGGKPVKRLNVNGVTVTFTADGEAVIETEGKTLKINTADQTAIEVGSSSEPPTDPAASSEESKTEPPSANQDQAQSTEPVPEEETDPETYYGYELINVPTPRKYEKYAFSVHFTHRFTQSAFNRSAADLFGFDSFSASGFGFSFGITDRIFTKIYRTPLARTIEMGGGVHLLHQGKKAPLSAAVYASVEGTDNFNENFTTNIVGMLGRSFSNYGAVFFAPTVSINSNPLRLGGPDNNRNTGSFGFGGQFNFRPTGSFIFEYTPRIGYKNAPNAEIGFGIQKRTYRHTFTLTVSNTIGTTTSQYNSGFGDLSRKGLANGLTIGFNIWRRFY